LKFRTPGRFIFFIQDIGKPGRDFLWKHPSTEATGMDPDLRGTRKKMFFVSVHPAGSVGYMTDCAIYR
jgi:hypothetical protein